MDATSLPPPISKIQGNITKEQDRSVLSVSCLINKDLSFASYSMLSSNKGLANDYSAVLNKDSDVKVEILKERYGFLDGLDVPMDGLDILLFINSADIFSEIILVLLSLLQLRE